jgi:hypothetical protein
LSIPNWERTFASCTTVTPMAYNPSWAEEPGEGDLRGATKDPPYALPNGAYPGFPGDPAYIGFVLFFFGGTHLGCLITAMGHGA